jgi:hypothetical protein
MATKKNTVQAIQFPRTINDLHRELFKEIDSTRKTLRLMQEKAVEALNSAFKLAGGCECCGGRGWVVVWDTMDSLSGCYAEYGACTAEGCTEAKRAQTGLNLATHSKYDSNRGLSIAKLRSESPVWSVLVTPYETILADLETQARDLDLRGKVVKGSKVVIKRGKTEVGKVGVVAYIKGGEWGDKVLIKDEDRWQDRAADGVWTYAKNVEVLAE